MVDMAQAFMGQSCIPQSFTYPALFGAQFTNLDANLVTNYSAVVPQGLHASHHATAIAGLSFCNVSIQYTHAGYNDNVRVGVWLPIENWNGRLQGSGGGGFAAGLFDEAMAAGVNAGYAVVSTDGGHVVDGFDVSTWALTSPGNINWMLLQDFTTTTLEDAAIIGKAITKDFYGEPPARSYWNGCSMGGRQGLQLAQRYPTAYDGILAAAPAINGPKFITAEFWPQMVMHQAGEYPPPCEFDAITEAAIEACDELDGVRDGIVSAPELCNFDARKLIGKKIECEATGSEAEISPLAVKVIETAWEGARRPDGGFLWYGLNHEAPLTGLIGLANTICEGKVCQPAPFPITQEWMRYFNKRDPDFDVRTLKHEEVSRLFHQSHQIYQSIISADDPDLTSFRQAGGKMITWHGLGDQVIPPNGSRAYYEAVTQVDPQAQDFYRLFEVPGLQHCWGGVGPYPSAALDQLVNWVESGKAPDVLHGRSLPDDEGNVIERDICAYPLRWKYKGTGDHRLTHNFVCA